MTLSLFDARQVAAASAFEARVAAAMAVNANIVYSESWFSNTTVSSAAGSRVLSFGSIPGWVTPGASLADLTTAALIPAGTIVTGTATAGGTVTLTLSGSLSGSIGAGHTIAFTQHGARAAFASQVVNQSFNMLAICLVILSSASLQIEGVNDGSGQNGIPDVDLNFTISNLWNFMSGA